MISRGVKLVARNGFYDPFFFHRHRGSRSEKVARCLRGTCERSKKLLTGDEPSNRLAIAFDKVGIHSWTKLTIVQNGAM